MMSEVKQNPDWFDDRNQRAEQLFKQLPWPSRKEEKWRYTSTKKFEHQLFVTPQPAVVKEAFARVDVSVRIPNAIEIITIDGVLQAPETPSDAIVVMALDQAILQGYVTEEMFGPEPSNRFHAQREAAPVKGCFVSVKKNCLRPVHLIHLYSGVGQDVDQQALSTYFVHNIIALEASANLVLVESYASWPECAPYMTNTATNIRVGEKSCLDYARLGAHEDSATHVGQLNVNLSGDAQFDGFLFCNGGNMQRQEVEITFTKEHAVATMNALVIGDRQQHLDTQISMHHRVGSCRSSQNVRTVLAGRSRSVFGGRITVAENAQQTDASQRHKSLLLNAGVRSDVSPQLDILASDVRCAHGASIGQLDRGALFYLQSRGISKEAALRLLCRGFIEETVASIKAPCIQSLVRETYEQCHVLSGGYSHDT